MKIGEVFDDDDREEMLKYASFDEKDVQYVLVSEEGRNDEADWALVVKLKNGKFGVVIAGCDYTGWD